MDFKSIVYVLDVKMLYQSIPSDFLDIFENFCGRDNYGAVNATFSALMFVPMKDDGEILDGTLKMVIDMHPTSISLVPSLMWSLFQNGAAVEETLLLQLDGIIASTGQVVLFPDYMGYAENAKELYKGYTVKKAYETSCVPMAYWAQKYVSEHSDCSTVISNTVGVKGYSEGGLSAIVLADALFNLGWNIAHVHAGGGPYKMSAETTTKTFERIVQGQYDMYFRHILALVGSSYSSTYRDLPNFNQGQDMLTEAIRPTVVDLIAQSTPETIVKEFIPEDKNELLSLMFDAEYLDFVNASVSNGNYDPCGSTSQEELIQRNLHLICEAFQMNDASNMLLNARYTVTLCHSPEDEVVPFESVPDISDNDNLSLTTVSGSHNEAAGQCIFNSLLYYLSPTFQTLAVDDESSSQGCNPIGDSESPNNENAMTESPSSSVLPEDPPAEDNDIGSDGGSTLT